MQICFVVCVCVRVTMPVTPLSDGQTHTTDKESTLYAPCCLGIDASDDAFKLFFIHYNRAKYILSAL